MIMPSDIDWISSNYPGLNVSLQGKSVTIRGCLLFSARYDKGSGCYVINPSLRDELHIEDSYQIEIFAQQDSSSYPMIKEIGGRLLKLANQQKVDSRNLHVYSSAQGFIENLLCTVGPIDQELIKTTLSVQDLIERILIPFFYDSSYYEKTGCRMRADYSHGIWGIIENYYESVVEDSRLRLFAKEKLINSKEWKFVEDYFLNNKRIQGHHKCIVCKNDKKIRDCHLRVFRGIRKIQDDKIFTAKTILH